MESCEILYEERFSATVLSRIIKTLLVFLVFCAISANVRFSNPAAGQSISADTETVLPDGVSKDNNVGLDEADMPFVTDLVLKPIISGSDKFMISMAPATTLFPTESENDAAGKMERSDAVIPEGYETAGSEKPAAIVPEDSSAIIQEDSPVTVSGEPEAIISDEPEATMPESPEAIVPEDAAVPIPPENAVSETVPGVIDGFLVNESGIIYGISDPDLIVNDGYMEFPTEGCTGIAAGTFSGGFPSVREIFIPANITYIEAGAFSGLTNMEWFEMESAGTYYTEEGVLFSEGGTCLLAFPAGRTGNYKVPSQVVRIAVGAFDNAQIEVLDVTACTLTDASGIPGNIDLLVR